MGTKYEVHAWILFGYINGESRYQWVVVYQGQRLLAALVAARKAKKDAGCVKLEWRG